MIVKLKAKDGVKWIGFMAQTNFLVNAE